MVVLRGFQGDDPLPVDLREAIDAYRAHPVGFLQLAGSLDDARDIQRVAAITAVVVPEKYR